MKGEGEGERERAGDLTGERTRGGAGRRTRQREIGKAKERYTRYTERKRECDREGAAGYCNVTSRLATKRVRGVPWVLSHQRCMSPLRCSCASGVSLLPPPRGPPPVTARGSGRVSLAPRGP
eukprot:9482980-Pyramimonas_sp.AAC.3